MENGAAGVQGGVREVEMIADRLRSVERQLRGMGSEAEMWGGGGHGETPSEGCQARLQRTICPLSPSDAADDPTRFDFT